LLFLTGCSQQFDGQSGILQKEFIIGGERVTVGGEPEKGLFGATTSNFTPEIKLEKWGTETYVKIWAEDYSGGQAQLVSNEVVWDTDDRTYKFYPVEIDEHTEGFEYEIVLKEKPKSNVIELKIETKDLVFYYQPPLTEDSLGDGLTCSETKCVDGKGHTIIERPEEIVGSCAVYHATKKNHIIGQTNYETGKAFHIYRPHITDSDGWKVWGGLDIYKEGALTITMPQEFWDKAVYPVIVDPTLGYTSMGGSAYGNPDTAEGIHDTSDASGGTISTIHVGVKDGANSSYYYSLAAYAASGSNYPTGSPLDTPVDITPDAADVGSFLSTSYSGTLSASTKYWVASTIDSGWALKWGIDAADANRRVARTAASLPDPWPSTDNGNSGHQMSFYVTYEAAAAGVQADHQFKSGDHSFRLGNHSFKK